VRLEEGKRKGFSLEPRTKKEKAKAKAKEKKPKEK
jgi:hypothetical protein